MSEIPEEIFDILMDTATDCADRMAEALAWYAKVGVDSGERARQALDGYAAWKGRENIPPSIWAAMGHG
jgi:hypothetical protein